MQPGILGNPEPARVEERERFPRYCSGLNTMEKADECSTVLQNYHRPPQQYTVVPLETSASLLDIGLEMIDGPADADLYTEDTRAVTPRRTLSYRYPVGLPLTFCISPSPSPTQ